MAPTSPTTPRRAVLYGRCSTGTQELEVQMAPLRRFAAERGYTVVAECSDVASGARADREGLGRALAELRAGRADVLVCVKLDRLARSVRHLTELAEELESLGADMVCTSQSGIDTTTPAGKLLYHVLASVSEFERGLIVDRTKAGLDAARARGARLGRPAKLSSADVETARRALTFPGATLGTVARDMKVSRRTLERALARERSAA